MKLSFVALSLSFLLVACVDTTGISAELSKKPKGSQSPSVMVTEFGDIQCPACRAAHETIVKPLSQEFSNQIGIEFRHFPLRAIHPNAFEAAQASECAADQGKFWEFLDMAYAKQDEIKNRPFEDWAEELQLDMDLFHRCLASGIKGEAILREYNSGQDLGVSATPTFFVNGTKVPSAQTSLEALRAAIRSEMQKIGEAPL